MVIEKRVLVVGQMDNSIDHTHVEMAEGGLVNALTTVQKDNLVMEKTMAVDEKEKPIVTTEDAKRYRIRKLTPRECWRLMGYSDEDLDKAACVNSNSQLYKEAGNAIVEQVLMAIFLQLNIQGKKNWNDSKEVANS